MEHFSADYGAVDQYLLDLFVSEGEALRQARLSSAQTRMPHAEIAPNQGAFLALLVEMMGAKRILEFGTLAGYSTIWLARAAGTEGRVTTLELHEEVTALAKENIAAAGLSERVRHITGPAQQSAQALIDSGEPPFDFVFVDADKPKNRSYLELSLQLCRPGSVIVLDNVVRGGAVIQPSGDGSAARGVQESLAFAAAHPGIHATALQTVGLKGWDGFALLRVTDPWAKMSGQE